MAAAAQGQTAIAEKLLSAGADLAARDQNNWTALIWAAEGKHEETMALLKQAREAQSKG